MRPETVMQEYLNWLCRRRGFIEEQNNLSFNEDMLRGALNAYDAARNKLVRVIEQLEKIEEKKNNIEFWENEIEETQRMVDEAPTDQHQVRAGYYNHLAEAEENLAKLKVSLIDAEKSLEALLSSN